MEKHPLQERLPELAKSEEVTSAVEKHESLTGEKISKDNPSARIETYLDRLENIVNPPPLEGHPDFDRRERNLNLLRPALHDAFIIKPEQVPESYFELQQRVARERGQPVENIPQNLRAQMIEAAIEEQRASLDRWVNYLTSDDAMYPTWFKYFVFRNIVKLSQFDKALGKFKERTASTVAPFPDIYYEPLAQICDIYERAVKDKTLLKDPEIKATLAKKFPTLYAELIQKSLAVQFENKESVKGEWIQYKQGNKADATKLFASLQEKGTGWCTAGETTANAQINSGDFYVFYSEDKSGTPTQPRIAIRMQGGQIAEIRGILPHQQLEPQMTETLDTKLAEFGPEADRYKKKSSDMRRLTEIDQRSTSGEQLTKDELIFLYEIDSPIEGFGYDRDPRIKEVQSKRNLKEDAPIVLDCKPEQIAWSQGDITENTKSYIGPLFPGIFQKNLDQIATRFPEGNLRRFNIEIGGKTATDYKQELVSRKINVNDYTNDLLESKDFFTAAKVEQANLVRLTVKDLGFPQGATTDEIYAKAKEYGLELCSPDVGPALRLAYAGTEYSLIAMKQIAGRRGGPSVFRLGSGGRGLWLRGSSAFSDFWWGADGVFVFRIRKADA